MVPWALWHTATMVLPTVLQAVTIRLAVSGACRVMAGQIQSARHTKLLPGLSRLHMATHQHSNGQHWRSCLRRRVVLGVLVLQVAAALLLQDMAMAMDTMDMHTMVMAMDTMQQQAMAAAGSQQARHSPSSGGLSRG